MRKRTPRQFKTILKNDNYHYSRKGKHQAIKKLQLPNDLFIKKEYNPFPEKLKVARVKTRSYSPEHKQLDKTQLFYIFGK